MKQQKEPTSETSTNQICSPYMTVPELAKYLKFPPKKIYALTCRNEIPHYQPGGRVILFVKEEIDNWVLESNKKPKPKKQVENDSIKNYYCNKKLNLKKRVK